VATLLLCSRLYECVSNHCLGVVRFTQRNECFSLPL